MTERLRTGVIAVAVTVFAVVSLGLVYTQSKADGGPIGEPFPEEGKRFLPAYARDSARIVTHENGLREVVFDRPEFPSKEVRDRQRQAAIAANDTSLLPFCAPDDEKGPPREPTPADFLEFPRCQLLVDAITLGPPGGPYASPNESTSNPEHTGIDFASATYDNGLYGKMTLGNPAVNHSNSGEGIGMRILAVKGPIGDEYWIEIGWIEGEWLSTTAPVPYSQACSDDFFDANGYCIWNWGAMGVDDPGCDTTGGVLEAAVIREAPSGTWRSDCWDGSGNQTWLGGIDIGGAQANRLNAFVETWEDFSGTFDLTGSLPRFQSLQVFDEGGGGSWAFLDSSLSSGITVRQFSGNCYEVDYNSVYYDFDVDDC